MIIIDILTILVHLDICWIFASLWARMLLLLLV
jgi:hypothetical protein